MWKSRTKRMNHGAGRRDMTFHEMLENPWKVVEKLETGGGWHPPTVRGIAFPSPTPLRMGAGSFFADHDARAMMRGPLQYDDDRRIPCHGS